MEATRWDRIEILLEAAQELPPDQQPGFLEQACGPDHALRAEVESLLAAQEEASRYFSRLSKTLRPGIVLARQEPEPDPYHLTGQLVSHYQIQEALGGGGMGVVYKAWDLRLHRTVALKFLPPEWRTKAEARQRFLQEARAASQLDHPYICTVHEVDEDGRFIVLAFYDGETLKQQLAAGPLPVETALELAIQIGKGMAYAHSHQVIHRDIKPSNVMLLPDGQVKIVDFGLATIANAAQTKTGVLIGTMAYMSPEQLRGERVDHRTDIWSLGVVLYELLTGQHPFESLTEIGLWYTILHREPVPLSRHRADSSPALERVLRKMLEKEPELRYSSMNAFVTDLQLLRERQPSGDHVPVEVKVAPSIAVLPFVNMSHEVQNEFFCDGLTEELINALTQLPELHVAARTSSFAFKGQQQHITEIGQTLKVATVLEGSVRKSGQRLRITAQLINTSNGYHLWSERYDRVMDDIFTIQDEITRAVVDQLRLRLVKGEGDELVKRPTENVEAYTLYLQGRHCWNRRTRLSLETGVECFTQALELDPHYAKAFSGLADCYTMLAFYGHRPGQEAFPLAQAALAQALALDPSLAEAYVSRGAVAAFYRQDWEKAAADFQHALSANPRYPTTYHWYAGFVLVPTGQVDAGLTLLRKARDIDPLSPIFPAVTAYFHWWNRHPEQALTIAQQTLRLNPEFWLAYTAWGLACEQLGRFEEALTVFQQAIAASEPTPFILGMMGHTYGLAGKQTEAHQVLARLETMAHERYVASYDKALVHLGLGEQDQALTCLEAAYDEQAGWLLFLAADPRLIPLHTVPRFQALLQRMHLPPRETPLRADTGKH
jgi:serine/threonine protein kinase/tetratricopeptide (TPR) repeat protein